MAEFRWLLPGTMTLLLWALWGILPKLALGYTTPQKVMVYEWLGGTIVALGILAYLRFQAPAPAPAVIFGLVTGMAGMGGAPLYMMALDRAPLASPVVAFTSLYPGIAVLLAYVFLRERPTLQQWAGILLAGLAVLLIATGAPDEAEPAASTGTSATTPVDTP